MAGTDGVGTKLELAFMLERHDTIGVDCVAMCVNDVITTGAVPLFFLDYVATGALDPAHVEAIVSGVADGCELAGCALLGGETAEMPGFYPSGEYDVAGFCVGAVRRADLLDPIQAARPGDQLIGFASSGIHSNGFSLVRKILRDRNLSLEDTPEGLDRPLGEALLEPTRIYVAALEALRERFQNQALRGLAHITGGGLPENLARALGERVCARVDLGSWSPGALFEFLLEQGELELEEASRVFNMGVGFVALVEDRETLDEDLEWLSEQLGYRAWRLGELGSREDEETQGDLARRAVEFVGQPA